MQRSCGKRAQDASKEAGKDQSGGICDKGLTRNQRSQTWWCSLGHVKDFSLILEKMKSQETVVSRVEERFFLTKDQSAV